MVGRKERCFLEIVQTRDVGRGRVGGQASKNMKMSFESCTAGGDGAEQM